MKDRSDKLQGEKRRRLILTRLRKSAEPLTGQALAAETNVSRQIIVQDISLLKAEGEPIIATARGYLYVPLNADRQRPKRVIAVRHMPGKTAHELHILADHGVTVLDVIVEHPIYGDLTRSLMLRSRHDVDEFLQKLQETNAALLSELTNGIHLHTIEAETEEQLDEAAAALQAAGILLES